MWHVLYTWVWRVWSSPSMPSRSVRFSSLTLMSTTIIFTDTCHFKPSPILFQMELYAKQKSINEGYEERKQREEQLAASASSAAPAVTEDASGPTEDASGPSTLTTPSYMTAAFTVTSPATMIPSVSPGPATREFASMSPESLQTIEQSDVVQTKWVAAAFRSL